MKSKFDSFEFVKFEYDHISSFVSKRDGETKIGEKIDFEFNKPSVKYVILGISEDIGPQANLGLKGSENSFKAFISRFVNVQSNRFLSGEEICILGEVKQLSPFIEKDEARNRIEILDDFIQKILIPIVASGKIPIVIGGGHNNAYPLINSCFSVSHKSIDVINLDPHADCRQLEGRHSGNPFSYAKANNFLNNYSVLGLHQQYNSEGIYQYLDENKFFYSFFEDYLDRTRNFREDIKQASKNREKEIKLGIELDLDSISMIPTSAFTPSGFSVEEARIFVREVGNQKNIAYLHLPEGAPQTDLDFKIVGKTLTYLVTDFIKVNKTHS